MFAHSRAVLESKRKHLKAEGKGSKKNKADPIDEAETNKLYERQILGGSEFCYVTL